MILEDKEAHGVSPTCPACVRAKLFQVVSESFDPMDCSPSGSSVLDILQARILERVACPPPGDLPDPGVEPAPPVTSALKWILYY